MRSVSCAAPGCGTTFSAEDIDVAETALAEHVKMHAGDGFSSADTVLLLDALKADREIFTTFSQNGGVPGELRAQAAARVGALTGLLS